MTELQFSNQFARYLADACAGNAPIGSVRREQDCWNGRPDFLGMAADAACGCWAAQLRALWERAGLNSLTTIAMLKRQAPRTARFIGERLCLPDGLVAKHLRRACDTGLVSACGRSAFRLSADWPALESDIWAFELKLFDGRRALKQAVKAQAYASVAVCVFPAARERVLRTSVERFRRFGIGLAVFHPDSRRLEYLARPRRVVPYRRSVYLETVGKFARGEPGLGPGASFAQLPR